MKALVALDFDHTVITENSDHYITKLAPGGKIPDEIKSLYTSQNWTKYMAEIFRYLHRNKVTESDIRDCILEIELVKGMKDLFLNFHRKNIDIIIISDANSIFIDWLIKAEDLSHCINAVFTNPAYFDEEGCLQVNHYHTQDWCDLSTVNLCKGHILESFIAEQAKQGIQYDLMAYAGDGTNDLCPMLKLKNKHDLALPRVGYSLMEKMDKSELPEVPTCRIIPWTVGSEIEIQVEEAIKSLQTAMN